MTTPQDLTVTGVRARAVSVPLAHRRIPLSSHLFPEVSAHLLAVTPTAHHLEWMDLAGPVLRDPVRPVDGAFPIAETPGFGIEWDEDAVARYAVSRP